ncbi:hypothetical protein TpMuguga_02g00492 [Theileria parva strain Muguga]|uniref:Thioredoxin domain-containing protein n=1 Tax=Theileria parva TaxID=5875 RepID=Q4N4Z8_THEPA|nr:uncharacterized protein TpMuguga_02g00492 [Theileria parva strain Muguga]EAN32775.1 hypothetical protein TpMuguga_02g00492 [Theileria parva strain Muguga]|eukprot:XP_765058.1 hypothetical protein [Theileria parva strain Muguga]
MLLLSKFLSNWRKLPDLSCLNSNRPLFLYLYSKSNLLNSDFSEIFSTDDKIVDSVKNQGVECYSEDISRIPCKLIDKFEVTTVPSILAILNGSKVGQIVKGSGLESFVALSQRLKNETNPTESALVTNLRDLISHGNPKDIRANISFIKNNFVRELEVDPTLFRLFSEGSILSHNNNEYSLETLKKDLSTINIFLKQVEDSKSSYIITGKLITQAPTEIQTLADKYNSLLSGSERLSIIKDGLKKVYRLKVKILELISVKHFIKKNMEESIKCALDSYKTNVDLLQKDMITLHEFHSCETKEVLESLLFLLDPYDICSLETRAELENVLGPRLLNEIPVSQRPLGGVTKKRRGFGGRYIWQGIHYRPKRYKPKNLKQYLNEWRCVHDSNPPSFN